MAKGGTFENEICRKLSLWWTEGSRDDVFTRTAGSGGRFTVRKKAGKDTESQSGDITYNIPEGKPLLDCVSIECKTGYGKSEVVYKKSNKPTDLFIEDGDVGFCLKKTKITQRWDLLDMVDSRQTTTAIEDFLEQAMGDAEHRDVFVIFRRNNRNACIIIQGYLLDQIADYLNVDKPFYLTFPYFGVRFCLLNLDQFFTWFKDPQEFFQHILGFEHNLRKV
jgi:hypothetical protein